MRTIDQQTRIEWEGGHLEVTKRDDGSVHVQIGNEDQIGVGLTVEETARLAAGFHAMFPAVSPKATDLAAEAFLQSVVTEMCAWLDVPGRDDDSQRNLVLGALQNLRLHLRDWPGERLN